MCGACADNQKLFEDSREYARRLANVLNQPAVEFSPSDTPTLPQSITTALPQVDISLTDFYALRDCPLYTLVAERNTALGKIQSASQRYIYENRLLNAVDDCLPRLDDSGVRDKLRHWRQMKHQALNQVWLRLLNSTEVRKSLALGQGYLTGNDRDGLSQTVESLQYLISLHPATAPHGDFRYLEQHLNTLQQFHTTASLLRSQRLLAGHLSQLTEWLSSQAIYCSDKQASDEVRYLRNVFDLFFIQRIQPVASSMNHYHYKLFPLWQTLIGQSADAYQQWLEQQQSDFEHYQQAMREHIHFWQALFKQCHLPPPAASIQQASRQ
ncbi:DUF3080 family protein [Bowmanella dokdonensis]|uniref:DUF3080 family protein n=1 Tax=Bowmanella dokdonensis TaxID=751969 RepID=A0A939ILQ3_9ALTE|nr:DUF3080 family protein [Bowmanella dokdonensis]MBN7824458.1 DUF3080 family protein [Bowmanella dokdonensis]